MAKVKKGYRLPVEIDKAIQRLVKKSNGVLRESDIVRLALPVGLAHVEQNVLPLVGGALDLAYIESRIKKNKP